mmetsp:Transcript_85166/g.150677  ORF Transcript_85166/g.150677 Transcript_85166/m.150677 type:complete len:586 (+) Transcript_85166:122-1879(+)|eukprot:CAMPEP_0197630898 /NCGR_PEP_ID=MMETSP1338-20131121/8240_1 /TAXON_ID=43686 ORGANISM="Pelagodinium beii, Strain RCC1491" /NCGR_SAMPLE_ID=MMETSP1338 /ASSEMBLY_ACC=CAM_ASM_000754 /LENGTH=585 /DNA_ID=CAMNT_0043202235 /DNA_START=122 /DNA_END=1879 /DNA_ORIENTATION=+
MGAAGGRASGPEELPELSNKKLEPAAEEPAPDGDAQAAPSTSIFGYATLTRLVQKHRKNTESQDAPRPPPKPPPNNPRAELTLKPSSSGLQQSARDAAEVEAIKSLGLNPAEAKKLSRIALELAALQQETGRTATRPDSGMDVQKSKSAADASDEDLIFEVLLQKLQQEAAEHQSQEVARNGPRGVSKEDAGSSPKSNDPWEAMIANAESEKNEQEVNPDLEMYMSGMAEDWFSKQPTKKSDTEHLASGQSRQTNRGSSAGNPERPMSHQDPALQFALLKPNPPGSGEKRMAYPPSKETVQNNLRAGNWSARPLKPPTPAPEPRKCPSGHGLEKFFTPKEGFTCDVCNSFLSEGSTAYGCRPCDFDVCGSCSLKADAAKIHDRSRRRPGEIAAKKLKKQQAVHLPPKLQSTSQFRSGSHPDLTTKGASLRQAAGLELRYSSQAFPPANAHWDQARHREDQAKEVLRDLEERKGQQLTAQQCAEMLSRWAGTTGSAKQPLVPQGGRLGASYEAGGSFNNSQRFVAAGALLSGNASPSVSPTGLMRGRMVQSHVSLAEGQQPLGVSGGRLGATTSRADLVLAAVGNI